MDNISLADFWKDLLTIDNGTVQWDLSRLVSKMRGDFHDVPRTIANTLVVLIVALNSGSLLAIVCRGVTRFTANLRIVTSLSASNLLIGVSALLDNIRLVPVVDGNAETCAYLLRKALANTSHVMSLLNLLSLAVDHYIVVCSPMDTFLQRSTTIKIVIVTLWVFLRVRELPVKFLYRCNVSVAEQLNTLLSKPSNRKFFL